MALPPSIEGGRNLLLSARKTAVFLRLIAAFGVAFFIIQIKLDYIESFLYDIRASIRPISRPTGLPQLIFADQVSVEAMHRRANFADYAKLVDKLVEQKPDYILFNMRFDELEGSIEEKQKFAEAAAKFENLYIITEELEMKGEVDKLKLSPPLDRIKVASGPKTSDVKIFAKDSVSRRMLVNYQGQSMIHQQVAGHYNPPILNRNNIRGIFEFYNTDQLFITFRPTGTYPQHHLSDVLAEEASKSIFTGKIVIIGTNDERTSKDYLMTPFSRELLAMTTTEMHANMFDTLIKNDAVVQAPTWLNYLITAIISLITIHIVFTLKPLLGLMILGSTVLALFLVGFFFFWPFGIWVQMAHPALAIFICYYFFIPYRLIVENRRSWEYYQKNKLLHQVEELKTNFISMMSHDLKTPIARIQGMADLILKDQNTLSSNQREGIDSIQASAQDLLKFINAILQYGRIESQGVELNLQSRDINILLKEVIKKHEFLAKIKKIHVLDEFEILFPIKTDPDLMKQVFSNLLENAIKYSPEDSKVLVTTEEKDGKIVVQVSDQGPGIPHDEIPNIFMKFFRSKNAKSSPIKGSGLGLYLAKYFAELHGGTISVESTYGQGCTFTVELPLDSGFLQS